MNSRPTKQLTGLLLTLAFVLIPLAALSAGAAASSAAPPPTPTPALRASGRIAFTHLENFFDGEDIYTVNPDGTGRAHLISLFGRQEDPAWSPDGKYIAYASGHLGFGEIYRADADGANQTRLSDGIAVGAVDDFPAWSPDGQQIVFVRNRQLWTIGKDGGTAVKLSTGTDEDEQPAWSPDGTRIIFVRNYSSANAQVWVMNADGTGQANLSNYEFGPDRTPAWSPDGSKIAYQRWNDIWLMNADGSNQTQITFAASGGYWKPSWSPDGTQIVVTNGLNFEGEIFVMNADGSNITKIADGVHPTWQSLPPLSLAAADSPDPVAPGAELTYTLVVANNHTLTAAGATLTDALDAGTTFVSAASSRGSCATPAVGATGTVTCSFGDLAAGEGATVTLVVQVAAADGATLHNAATAAADYAGHGQQTQSAETSTQVIAPSADVYTGASVETLYVPTGGQVVYNAFVFNAGPAPAAGVTLTSNFPAGVTFAAVNDDSGGSCAPAADGVNFTCAFASIDLFNGHGVRVTANSNVAGAPYTPVTTTFTVASTTPDHTPDNNTGSIEFYIAAPPLPTPTPGATDAEMLAFDKQPQSTNQRDIYRQRADGAGLVNLTDSAAHDDNFTWSPDGSRLAFLRFDFANQIVSLGTVAADGSGLTLLTGVTGEQIDNYSWSPDGSRFVFSTRPYFPDDPNVGDVYVMNADGTGRTSLTNGDGVNSDPSWSPDGTRISYVRAVYSPTEVVSSAIRVVGANGSGLVQLPQAAGEIDSLPRWSPDGARLAFTRRLADFSRSYIQTARADGTDPRRLTDGASTYDSNARWSPDGSKLSFDSNGHTADIRPKLELVNADGTGRTTIYEAPADASSYNSGSQKWSPDGSRMVFQICGGECAGSSLYVVNADGTGRVELGLSAEQNHGADWSPDGSRLAFMTNRNGVNRINIIRPDGTGRVELPGDASFYGSPKWRPAAQPSGDTPAGANVTVAENGVAVTFANVTTAGETTVTPIDPNSLQGVPGEYVINANTLAFEITTTATYAGPITIGFHVPGVNNPITFSTLRVLHGEPPPVPNFVDRTVLAPDSPAPNFPTRTVYARVTSLSPFVVAQRADTTGPVIQITSPAAQTYVVKQAVAASYTCTDAGSGILNCTGTVPSGAAVNTATVGAKTFTVNAKDNAGNTSVKSVAYKVAYGVTPTYDQTKVHKSGSTIHLSLRLVDALGANLSAAGVGVSTLNIALVSSSSSGSVEQYSSDDPDADFTYKNGEYSFKLKTKNYAAGTYRLSFRAGSDPTVHTIEFRIRQ